MPRNNTHSTHEAPPVAFLFSVHTSEQSVYEVEASLSELKHLLRGLGAVVPEGGTLVQRQNQAPGPMVLGAGKLNELREMLSHENERGAGKVLLVFDGELSPGQQRNLARSLEVEVLDRTQVILRIFSQRARTRTAQLEIELAGLQYESPRIRDDEALGDKQAGGGGRAAKGDTSVQLRKQELRKRLAELREEIAKAGQRDDARRKRRERINAIALVGYTNAGKSSWMRALSGSDVLVQDALFATLDTTVRKLHPPTRPEIVVADTVGFLRNLPNHLLASFSSTLNEALDADVLLFVIDGSDPEWQAHLQTTRDVLGKVGAGEIPVVYVVNKVDQMSEEAQATLRAHLPDALLVSSRSTADVTKVRNEIISFFDKEMTEVELMIPFAKAALRSEICATGRVISESFDEQGGLLKVLADEQSIRRWKSQLE